MDAVEPPREDAIRWLRWSYRAGAFVDALATVEMLLPDRLDTLGRFGPKLRKERTGFRYGMRTGAPLMAGWTALLLWADRDPLARKDVLPLTIAPVIAGLMANDAVAEHAGLVSGSRLAPIRAMQVGLTALFAYSWLRAR
jgi:hypothetical protein